MCVCCTLYKSCQVSIFCSKSIHNVSQSLLMYSLCAEKIFVCYKFNTLSQLPHWSTQLCYQLLAKEHYSGQKLRFERRQNIKEKTNCKTELKVSSQWQNRIILHRNKSISIEELKFCLQILTKSDLKVKVERLYCILWKHFRAK